MKTIDADTERNRHLVATITVAAAIVAVASITVQAKGKEDNK